MQPVQAVGLSLPTTAAHQVIVRACSDEGTVRCTWTWVSLPLWAWLEQMARCAMPMTPQRATRTSLNQAVAEPSEKWRPWPAHPPFADEVTRWWPSDELPPLDSSLACSMPEVLQPILIQLQNRGGVIDLFV